MIQSADEKGDGDADGCRDGGMAEATDSAFDPPAPTGLLVFGRERRHGAGEDLRAYSLLERPLLFARVAFVLAAQLAPVVLVELRHHANLHASGQLDLGYHRVELRVRSGGRSPRAGRGGVHRQRVAQLVRGRPPVGGSFGQRALDRDGEHGRHVGTEIAQAPRRLGDVLHEHGRRIGGAKGRRAGEHLIADDAERVDVAAAVDVRLA